VERQGRDIDTHKQKDPLERKMKEAKMIAPRDAYGQALVKLVDANPDVVVLDADVCTSTKTSLVRDKHPDRFYEIGIAEQNMFSIAAGMATVGLIPYACTFAVFASKRAADQVSIQIAYTNLPVKVSGAYGGIPTGKAGATHQSVEDIAIMRAMPNMTVIEAADAVETEKVVLAAAEIPGPVYIRTIRCEVPVIFDDSYEFKLGKSITMRAGDDVAIIACGIMTAKAMEASDILAKEGISARVLNMPTIKPIDEEAIVQAAEETKGIVTAENHSVIGGLGGAVAEVLTAKRPTYQKRIGIPDCFGESGDNEAIFTKYGMNVDSIAQAAREIVQRKG